MSAVYGESVADSSDAGAPLDAPEQQTPVSTGAEGEQSGQVVADQGQQQEVDVTTLDLTQSQNIQQFRSSYEKLKYEREQDRQRADQVTQELETMRASADRGVYLRTDIPIEDFKPRESLMRMADEEPEYYEAVAADFMEAHFWPELGEQIRSIEGRPLNPNDPVDAQRLESLSGVWDTLSRRMSKGQLDGESLYSVLEILEGSPDLQQVILARMNGNSASLPAQGGGQQQGWNPNQGIENATVIAQRYGLDPTDDAHAALIQQHQAYQREKLNDQAQRQRELQQRDLHAQAMQRQIDELKNNHEGLRNTTTEEAQRRAASRLNELLETSLESDIQTRYAAAIPKDRPGLLGDLKTISKATLEANGDYKAAIARAEKWFRQAAGARDGKDRDRWDKAGLDALTVVGNYRASAIAAAAERLLGPMRRTVARQDQRTRELQRGRREIPGGQASPPVSQRAAAAPGDIQATRDAIRRRIAEAQNQGAQGLPRVG